MLVSALRSTGLDELFPTALGRTLSGRVHACLCARLAAGRVLKVDMERKTVSCVFDDGEKLQFPFDAGDAFFTFFF